MKQVQWLALATGSVALAMATAVSPAEAAAITYSLQGVIMDYPAIFGGPTQTGSVTGSFSFDSVTNTFSNISINSPFTSGYIDPSISGSSTSTLLVISKPLLGTTATLTLNFATPLTGVVGNTFAILPSPSSSETLGSFTAQIRPGGSVVAIPTPALLPGLVGLGLATRRKRKAALAAAKA